MAITAPPTITALPTPPDPNDRSTFNTRAYPWSVAQQTFGTQLAAVASNVYNNGLEAKDQAGIATTKASEASASAALAKDWATKTSDEVVAGQGFGAKKYADDAALSAAAAAASALEAAGLVESYQGALAADPPLDKEGNPLAAGDWYINTVSGFVRAYNGTAWVQGISVVTGVSSLNGLVGDLTGFVTETGAQSLTNKTLTDPKLLLGGTNGTAGQVPMSRGAGLPPVWRDVALASADVTNALTYVPLPNTTPLVNHFNGRSGDVSLTSTDVTNALTFYPLSQTTGDARYPKYQFIAGATTLDNLVEPGIYQLGDPNTIGAPTGIWDQILVLRANGATVSQLLFSYTSSSVWFRTGNPPPYSNGTWGPWKKLIDSTVPLVNHFNGRTGAVTLTSGDVNAALGFWPRDNADALVESFNGRTGAVTLTSGDVNAALGFWPRDNVDALVESFNGRTGAVTLGSADVTNALGYTPLSDLGSNLGAGYTKLSNGLIMQWGTLYGIPTGTSGPYYFPVAFPNTCASLVFTGQNGYKTNASLVNKSSFNVYLDGSNLTASYIATGY